MFISRTVESSVMIQITCSILCYNYGRFLKQAIESCLNQDPGNYELDILVIDDGSTDETPEVCEKFNDHIRIVRSPNEGFGASLTKAIQLATGEYVCLLDADDYFHPKKLATLQPVLSNQPLIVMHGVFFIDQTGTLIDHKLHTSTATSGICVRRDAALTLLPVTNERFFAALDQPGKSVYLRSALTYYRVHGNSMQRNPTPGAWQLQLAAVNRSFTERLNQLINKPPFWASSVGRFREMKKESEEIAAFCELEASLQLRAWLRAMRCCARYLLVAVRHRRFSLLQLKMLIRTLFLLPVYKEFRRGHNLGSL